VSQPRCEDQQLLLGVTVEDRGNFRISHDVPDGTSQMESKLSPSPEALLFARHGFIPGKFVAAPARPSLQDSGFRFCRYIGSRISTGRGTHRDLWVATLLAAPAHQFVNDTALPGTASGAARVENPTEGCSGH
jgi:hypothetical protein